jgi:hypothetical protein
MENEEYINRHLKSSLEEFSVQPRISSFDEVLQKMKKEKKRRFFIWFLLPGLVLTGAMALLMVPRTLSHGTASISINEPVVKERTAKEKLFNKTKPAKHELISSNKNLKTTSPADLNNSYTNLSTGRDKAKHLKNDLPIKEENNQQNNSEIVPVITQAQIPDLLAENNDTIKVTDLLPEHLDMIAMSLPFSELQEPALTLTQPEQISNKNSDDKKNQDQRIKFMIGLAFDPQLTSFHLTKNKNFDPTYGSFPEAYLKSRKEQTTFKYNYAFGLKAGVSIRNKYEILIGFGFQRFKYSEKIGPEAVLLSNNSQNTGYSTQNIPGIYLNIFRYNYYEIEGGQYFKLWRFTTFKAGFGLQALNLRIKSSIYSITPQGYGGYNNDALNTENTNKWLYMLNFKLGFAQDITKRIQFRVCPSVFYSASSMFGKKYIIGQRPFGATLECLLLFRLN